MKNYVFKILRLINKVFFPSFSYPDNLVIPTFKNIFIQKFIGVNRKVSWPVHFTSKVISPKNIDIGTRAPGLSIGCYLDGRNGIIFGKNVWVGPRVSVISKNHSFTNYDEYLDDPCVRIGDNCWLASNVTILPGVELGSHIVVAAGAVVARSFKEDNILIGGVPAKKIKDLGEYIG